MVEDDIIIYSRRDKEGKTKLPIKGSADCLNQVLEDIQNSLFTQAKKFQDDNTYTVETYSEFKSIINKGGFVICGWDGTHDTEEKISVLVHKKLERIITELLYS